MKTRRPRAAEHPPFQPVLEKRSDADWTALILDTMKATAADVLWAVARPENASLASVCEIAMIPAEAMNTATKTIIALAKMASIIVGTTVLTEARTQRTVGPAEWSA